MINNILKDYFLRYSNLIHYNLKKLWYNRLCHEAPYEFQSVDLYIESLKMQSIYNFRLTARLFINDLFEILTIDEKALDRIDEIGGLKIKNTFDGNLE